MIRIALCDDSDEIRRQTRECLVRYFMPSDYEFLIDEYGSGEVFLESEAVYDIIFLDYKFENSEMDGLSIASSIRRRGDGVKIVFLSSYPQVVFKTFEFGTFRFLVKPVDDVSMKEVMDAFFRENDGNDRHICFRFSGNEYFVSEKDIVYVESAGKYCTIHRDKEENHIRLRQPLNKVAGELRGEIFFRCHNSYIVNFMYVSGCTSSEVMLTNGEQIPMSRHRYRGFMDSYGKYLSQNG